MKIFLTGASGMVGKNILEHPKANDHVFLSPSSKEVDLQVFERLNEYIRLHQPDLIIHAAGRVGGIQANMAAPVNFLVENLEMGKNIVIAAQKNNISKVLNLGSSCMYPRNASNPLKEELVLKGELEPTNEGYAIAKIVTAKLCEYIQNEDKSKEYKTIIPCNLYGRYDKFDPKHSHMIPAVIKKIFEAKESGKAEIDIWGDGTVRREFMYAGDLADFIFEAIKNYNQLPQYLNVGLGFDYTIREYYETIAEVVGYEGKFFYDTSKPVGMKQKLIDDTRLKEFGWEHKTSLKEGIKQAFTFYKNSFTNEL